VRHNVPDGWAHVKTERDDGRVVLSVTNSGDAVGAEHVERIFEPFQRLDATRASEREGLGLGLSIVKAVAEAHDASVTATPRDGGGLRVAVAFPSA
jgi:signal transduction histidine kinase